MNNGTRTRNVIVLYCMHINKDQGLQPAGVMLHHEYEKADLYKQTVAFDELQSGRLRQ